MKESVLSFEENITRYLGLPTFKLLVRTKILLRLTCYIVFLTVSLYTY